MIKISLIIAAYNVQQFIEKCIISCLNQEVETSDFEIIIINDGSSDETGVLIEELQAHYKNIHLINQKNSGLGAARNTGLKYSSGQYVWFLDGDDYIEENILSRILNEIELSELDALVLNYNVVDDQGNILIHKANDMKMNAPVITGSEFYKEYYPKGYSWSFIFKKSLFTDNQITFKERINMQDSEILPKLMLRIKRISFFEEASYNYVQHPNSFTNSSNGEKRFKYFESIIEVKKSLNLFLKSEAKDDVDLKEGITHKIEGLHKIVFNHLLFFRYDPQWLVKIIGLLKENNFYPLTAPVTGKFIILKWGLNNYPIKTKTLIDKIRGKRIRNG